MLSDRAMIAVCDVRLPKSVAIPSTSSRFIVAVSDGVRLCATKMCGSAAENTGFGDFLLHLENLDTCLHERGLEPRDLISNLRRFDVITRHVIEIVPHDMNDAARQPGRNARSLKPDFLVIAAHPRAIL